MSISSIFRDMDKLSPRYVPKLLQHREDQMKFLSGLYETALDNIEGKFLQPSQLVGPVGTGKTSTAIRFGEMLEEKASKRKIKLKHVYLNGKMEGASRYTLYRSLLADVTPKISTRSLSPEEMLRQLVNYLREEDLYLLITMDEIGYFCKHSKEQLVYNLTRLNELTIPKPSRVIGVMFIARNLSFHERLDPSELSTLGRLIVQFPRYCEQQIKDILEVRVGEAFKPGKVSDDVLGFVSDVTARPPINGDLRVALDLLLYSGMLAEREGYERVLPEHVRRVLGETHPSITTEDILYLSDARSKVQAAINAYRDYIQRSVNSGLADARTKIQAALNMYQGSIQGSVNAGLADSRAKTQAALNAYRDYIQKSVNAGLADAREKVQVSFNDLRGRLQANFNQTVSGANESLATLRDSTNRGLETMRSGAESGINTSAEKLRASVEDAFNTLIPTLWAMEGVPEGVLMTPAIYRNVTPTGFEVLSLGKMTVSYLAVGLKV